MFSGTGIPEDIVLARKQARGDGCPAPGMDKIVPDFFGVRKALSASPPRGRQI